MVRRRAEGELDSKPGFPPRPTPSTCGHIAAGRLEYNEGGSEGEDAAGSDGEEGRGGEGGKAGNFRLTLHLWNASIGRTGIDYIPSVVVHLIQVLYLWYYY